jgi:hypothetical protein
MRVSVIMQNDNPIAVTPLDREPEALLRCKANLERQGWVFTGMFLGRKQNYPTVYLHAEHFEVE